MPGEVVTYSLEGRVGHIRISRPDRRNALNRRAVDELHEGIRRATSDEVRALVVWGDGDQFCSGADLKELEDMEFTSALRLALDDLAAMRCPTIAAVAGACMGLGLQIAVACDLRLATPDAAFAVPVARLGLMVDHWTVQRLALLAGHSTARWMLLTAEPVTGTHAHDVGFVHRIVEPGADGPGAEVLAEASRLADRIAALAPLSLQGSKLGLDLLERKAAEVDPGGAYRAAFEAAWASDDLVEGRLAFTDRRPPEFRGR